MRAPFPLERYLADLRDQTAWAPDLPIEEHPGPLVPRDVLYRIAHLWTLALIDDRFDTLLLPVLATESPLVDALERENDARGWGLSRDYFAERLASGACLLLVDGVEEEAERWRKNVIFQAARGPRRGPVST